MRYLLDTNIVSDLVRNPQGRVAQHIREIGEAQVCTSIIVAAELRYGATKRGSPRLAAQLDAVLGTLDVLPLDAPADTIYGRLRARLEREGQPIGGTTYSSPPKLLHWATLSSATTRGNSAESTNCPARIGCVNPVSPQAGAVYRSP